MATLGDLLINGALQEYWLYLRFVTYGIFVLETASFFWPSCLAILVKFRKAQREDDVGCT